MISVIKKIFCILFILTFFVMPFSVEAKTLGEMKSDLASAKANLSSNLAKRKEAQNKINQYNSEIGNASAAIEKCETDINASREKIAELEIEIAEKNKEIEDLLRFMQVSNGENIYLEYMFGASDFTDFIYRAAVVEQLSEYNNNLIDEMYAMIEENKQLQKDLEVKIVDLNVQIESFKSKLSALDLSIEDLEEDQKDIAAEIKATEAEIQYYVDYGCKDDEEISSCLDIPYASGFTRPTTSGYMSSNFGYRYIWGRTSFHNGLDIALAEGNKVYASAAGYVSKKVNRASCGGNMVYIQHNIDGVKYTSVYMHLLSFNVNVGDVVSINSVIAYSGGGYSTMGYDSCTTGAHLHFGILKGWTTSSSNATDPRNFINFPAKYSRYYSRW